MGTDVDCGITSAEEVKALWLVTSTPVVVDDDPFPAAAIIPGRSVERMYLVHPA